MTGRRSGGFPSGGNESLDADALSPLDTTATPPRQSSGPARPPSARGSSRDGTSALRREFRGARRATFQSTEASQARRVRVDVSDDAAAFDDAKALGGGVALPTEGSDLVGAARLPDFVGELAGQAASRHEVLVGVGAHVFSWLCNRLPTVADAASSAVRPCYLD